MEYRDCEDYVLSELIRTKDKVEELNEDKDHLEKTITDIKEDLKYVLSLIEKKEYENYYFYTLYETQKEICKDTVNRFNKLDSIVEKYK